MLKLALTTTTPEIEAALPVSLLEGDFLGRLDKAAALGYDGVELMVARPDRLDPDAIRGQITRRGLEVAAISSGALASTEKLTLLSGDPETSRQAFDRLIGLIGFAARVGAPLVTIGSFRGRSAGQPPQASLARLADLLRRAGDAAARQATRLAIEPLNRYETDLIFNAAEGLAFIESAAHSQLGLLLDTFHVNIEEISLTDCFRQAMMAGRLWHVHLADSNRLPPGQGHLDLPGIFHALHEIGYPGYCSAELLARPTPDGAAQATIDYCRPYLAS